jgi:hypothetical protein
VAEELRPAKYSTSVWTPVFPPVIVIREPARRYALAGQVEYEAGVAVNLPAAPIVPVSPTTVTVSVPPSCGVELAVTEVTLFAEAAMSSSAVIMNVAVHSAALARSGRVVYTRRACDSEDRFSAVAVR